MQLWPYDYHLVVFLFFMPLQILESAPYVKPERAGLKSRLICYQHITKGNPILLRREAAVRNVCSSNDTRPEERHDWPTLFSSNWNTASTKLCVNMVHLESGLWHLWRLDYTGKIITVRLSVLHYH